MIDVFDPRPPSPSLIASICRCSSPHEHASRAEDQANYSARASQEAADKEIAKTKREYEARAAELQTRTPNPDRYEVQEAVELNGHLILKVLYPNCSKCAFEGNKVMVFLRVNTAEAIKWKRIDPHFRSLLIADRKSGIKEAPPPAARFPATAEGWSDALEFARRK